MIGRLSASLRLLAPLRQRGFRLLWAGMTVSLVGDGVTLVAIAWQVFELSTLPTALGLTMMAMSIPQVLLLLLGGFVSDRFDRRRVMLAADFVRCLAVLAMGLLSINGLLQVWHMAVIAAIYGAGNAFFGPAFEATVPELVPDSELTQANSLDQLVRPMALRLVGPAAGGWIIASTGVGWAFIIDAATFMVSMACLLRLSREQPAIAIVAPAEGADAPTIWAEIREGFDYVRSRVWLWGTFGAATLAYLVFLGPAEVLLPFLLKNELGGSAAELGTVFAAGGLGALSASVVMAQRGLPRRNMRFVYLMWAVSTLAVAGYGLSTLPFHVMLACFAFNVFETAGLIVWTTIKQASVPGQLLGRVSSLDWLISTALMPVSYSLAGPIADAFGTRPTLIGAGFLGSAITLAFLLLPGMPARVEPGVERLAVTPTPTSAVFDS